MSLKKIWLWKVGWVSRENNSLLSETGDDMHNDIWQMNTDEINMLLLLYADISCHAIITSMIVTINLSAVVSSIMHKSGMNDKISIWLYTRLRRNLYVKHMATQTYSRLLDKFKSCDTFASNEVQLQSFHRKMITHASQVCFSQLLHFNSWVRITVKETIVLRLYEGNLNYLIIIIIWLYCMNWCVRYDKMCNVSIILGNANT